MKIQIGDVVNFNWTNSPFFWIEKVFNKIHYGKSTATHSGIITRIEGETIWIMEAVNNFREFKYSLDWLKIKKDKITIRRPNIKLKNLYSNAMKYEGLKYDWISIFLMIFKLSRNSTNALFCSEAVGRILYDCGLDISSELGKNYEKLTPMDLQITKQLSTIKW